MVNGAVGIEAVVDAAALLLVQDDLHGLRSVLLGAEASADDLDGVDHVGEDGVVDGGQRAGTGALLLLVRARVGGALGAGEDAALSDEENVAVGELLFEFTGQAGLCVSFLVEVISEGRRKYRCWILWKPCNRGTGTKMMIAFLPWPTSTCEN